MSSRNSLSPRGTRTCSSKLEVSRGPAAGMLTEIGITMPVRRAELVIRPLGDRGPYVVKDPENGTYFQFGDEEYFLLNQLDGRQDAWSVRRGFADRFGHALKIGRASCRKRVER